MQTEQILAWAADQMAAAPEPALEPGYRYHHGLRVAKLALALARTEVLAVDEQLLYVGGLLHDVGKAGEQGKGHGPRGAELISQQIADLFSAEELRRVTEIVANHYMRPKSKYLRHQPDPGWSAEVLLVQDADTLDHFGANGIWIAHHWSTVERRSPARSIRWHWVDNAPWHEESRRSINFPAARAELERRIACMDAFVRQWELEEAGCLSTVVGEQ